MCSLLAGQQGIRLPASNSTRMGGVHPLQLQSESAVSDVLAYSLLAVLIWFLTGLGRLAARRKAWLPARAARHTRLTSHFREMEWLYDRLPWWGWFVLALCFVVWGLRGVVYGRDLLMVASGLVLAIMPPSGFVFTGLRKRRNEPRMFSYR